LDLNDTTWPQQLPPPPPPPPLPAPNKSGENPVFNLPDVLLIALVAISCLLFVCPLIGTLVFVAVHGFQSFDVKQMAQNALVIVPMQIAAYILTVGFMVLLIWRKYRTGFLTAVRWKLPRRKLAWGAIGGGVALGLTSQVLSGLLERWIPKSLPIEQYFNTPASAYMLAGFGILVAPLVEELFFRGLLYPALARPIGIFPAAGLTAISFAAIHAPQLGNSWAPLVVLLTISSVLTAARVVTKSVAFCVLIHVAYNFTLFAGLFIVTQGFRHMERG